MPEWHPGHPAASAGASAPPPGSHFAGRPKRRRGPPGAAPGDAENGLLTVRDHQPE
jgi:hypothetical protein